MDRILVLTKGLGRGGAEVLLTTAAPHLNRSRFAYEFAYLLPWKDALAGELSAAGFPVRCLGTGTSWVARLRRLVRERGIRLVHAHSPAPAAAARLGLWRWPVRFVYTEHNVWPSYHPVTRTANMLTFARNDHVFAVSREVLGSIRIPPPLHPGPPMETLYPGLDPEVASRWGSPSGVREELGVPAGSPMVVTVGNFRADKGHRYLLEAAVRVRRDVPEARFVLVGLGPLEGDIRERARLLRLDGTVLFAGFREDAPKVAGAADVFVLPSLREGLPVSLLEAMALRRPAVVTRVGGMPEVVEDGRTGLVVPPRDPEALAAAIVRLLRDRGLRGRLGSAAKERAAAFDIRDSVRRAEAVYAELLS